jgi:hypothetical protein
MKGRIVDGVCSIIIATTISTQQYYRVTPGKLVFPNFTTKAIMLHGTTQ